MAGQSAKPKQTEYIPVSRFENQSNKFFKKHQKTVINEEFFVPIKNVLFKNGGVSIFKKFNGYSETIELNIDNPCKSMMLLKTILETYLKQKR